MDKSIENISIEHERGSNVETELFLDYFKRVVRNFPTLAAIYSENEDKQPRTISFKELHEKSNQLAHYLISRGLISPSIVDQGKIIEPIVALAFNKTNPEWVISLLAVWKAGCAVLLLGREISTEECVYRTQNVKASAIITDDPSLLKHVSVQICLDSSDLIAQAEICRHSTLDVEGIGLTVDHLAYIAYTSGSTGDSKAIAINHRGLMHITLAHQEYLKTAVGDKMLQFSRFSFDACYMEFLMLSVGMTLVLESGAEDVRKYLGAYIKKHTIEVGIFVPSVLHTLAPDELPTKAIISTGEAGNEALFNRISDNGSRAIVIGYGPAECTIGVMLGNYPCRAMSLGQVITGTKLILLKPKENKKSDNESIAGKNEIGFSGDSLARGYVIEGGIWKDKTEQAFVVIDGMRIYRTGDLGHFDEKGELIFDGRKDGQLKIYGMRVESQAVTSVLRDSLAALGLAIEEADICVLPWYRSGIEKVIQYLEAFILVDDITSIETDAKTIRRQMMTTRLYKAAVPAKFYVLRKDPVFYSHSRKLNYKVIAKKKEDAEFFAQAELPFSINRVDHDARELTETEKDIERIWREMLNISVDYFIDSQLDEFCHWGANSLLEAELLEKLERKFKINFGEYPVFNKKITIDNLAREITRRCAYGKESWERLGILGDSLKPPVFFFHSVMGIKKEFDSLADKLGENQIVYVLRDPLSLSNNDMSVQLKDYNSKYLCQTIEEIASYAIYGIREIYTAKHYFVGGFSFGSILACEAARQLQHQNGVITWLGLIAPPAPYAVQNSLTGVNKGQKEIRKVIKMCFMMLRVPFENDNIKLSIEDLQQSPVFKIAKLFDSARNQIAKIHHENIQKIKSLYGMLTYVERNLCALSKYQQQKLSVEESSVFLYSPSSNSVSYQNAWEDFIAIPISSISLINAKHVNMLHEIKVQEGLKASLQSKLESVSLNTYLDYLGKVRVWHLPNPYSHFVGRRDELAKLEHNFDSPDVITQAICGFGGLGKTKLALAFAERYAVHKIVGLVAWFKVDSSLENSIQNFLYEKFKFKEDNNITRVSLVKVFYEKLAQLESVLLIFDDVTKTVELDDFIRDDRSPRIKILITSRDNRWPKSYKILDISTLDPLDAIALIKNHVSAPELQIENLARCLGCYPLALNQAVAYLSLPERRHMPVEQYIQSLEKFEIKLLEEVDDIIDRQYQKTLISIVMMAIDSLDRQSAPYCEDFLIQLSMIDHEGVHEEITKVIFQSSYKISEDRSVLESSDDYNIEYNSTISMLRRVGFVSLDDQTVKMHPIIQRIILALANKKIKEQLLIGVAEGMFSCMGIYDSYQQKSDVLYSKMSTTIIKILNLYLEVVPYYLDEKHGCIFNLLLGYAEFLRFEHNHELNLIGIDLIKLFQGKGIADSVDPLDLLDLTASYANILFYTDRSQDSWMVLSSELSKIEKLREDGKIIFTQSHLNIIKHQLLHFLPDGEVMLRMCEDLVRDEPDNPAYLHELGQVLAQRGVNYPLAYEYLKKAAELKKAQLGQKSMQYAITLQVYSHVASVIGRLSEAKNSIKEVYEIKNQWYLNRYNNQIDLCLTVLIDILVRCGDYLEAFSFLEKKMVSEKPYNTAKIILYINLGMYENARIAIDSDLMEYIKMEDSVGFSFRQVTHIYKAKLLALTGKYRESEELQRNVIEELNRRYRNLPAHNTLKAILELVYVLYLEGKFDEAVEFIVQIIDETPIVYKTLLHPTYAKALYYYGCVFLKKNNLSDARVMLHDGLAVQEVVYEGLAHPDLAETYRAIAEIEMRVNDVDQAQELLNKALSIQFTAYGKNPHPEIAKTYLEYAKLALVKKDIELAKQMQICAEQFVQVELVDQKLIRLVEHNRMYIETKFHYNQTENTGMRFFEESYTDEVEADKAELNSWCSLL